ncbi:MAG: hypothetical protein ABIJ81_02180 [Patescibacteria group bacterium]
MSINLNNQPHTNLGAKLLGWRFPEVRAIERSRGWWIFAGLIVLILLIYALKSLNFLFAVIIIIGVVIIWLDSRKKPALLDFAIHQQGITIAKRFWTWRELDHFWIAYRPPEVTSLYIQPKGVINPRLSVPLEKTNPLEVREILTKYLTENLEREDEPTSEALSRMLKIQ